MGIDLSARVDFANSEESPVVRALTRALVDEAEGDQVRIQAEYGLIRLAPIAFSVSTLAAARDVPSAEVRIAALNCLGRRGASARSILPQVVEMLERTAEQSRVRTAAAHAVARIGPREETVTEGSAATPPSLSAKRARKS